MAKSCFIIITFLLNRLNINKKKGYMFDMHFFFFNVPLHIDYYKTRRPIFIIIIFIERGYFLGGPTEFWLESVFLFSGTKLCIKLTTITRWTL